MRAGLLTEMVAVERPVTVKSPYGEDTAIWTHLYDTLAQVRLNGGARGTENGEVVFSDRTNFTLRIYHDVELTDRIVWKDTRYRVLSIMRQRESQSMAIDTEAINE